MKKSRLTIYKKAALILLPLLILSLFGVSCSSGGNDDGSKAPIPAQANGASSGKPAPEKTPSVMPSSVGENFSLHQVYNLAYSGKFDQALKLLDLWNNDKSRNDETIRLKGIINLYRGKNFEAVEDFQNLTGRKKKEGIDQLLLILAEIRRGNRLRALDLLTELYTHDENAYLYNYLKTLTAGGDDLKKTALERTLSRIPDEITEGKISPEMAFVKFPFVGDIFFLKGKLLAEHEHWKEAGKYYDLAEKYNPHNCEVISHRARVYEETHQYKRGIDECNNYLNLSGEKKQLDEVYMVRGRCWKELDVMKNAEADFEQALKLNPDNVTALVNLGFHNMEMGNIDRGRKIFRHVLELHEKQLKTGKSSDASQYVTDDDVGQAYYVVGEYTKALPYLEKAHKRTPDYTIYFYFLGDCYFQLGQYEKAEKFLSKASRLITDEEEFSEWEIEDVKRKLKKTREKLGKT